MRLHISRCLALLFLGPLSVIACGEAHQTPPADPPVDQSRCLKVAETSLDFGSVTAFCGLGERAITVLNRCSVTVSFSASLSTELAQAFSLAMPSKSEVPAEGWSQFQVRFIPSVPGPFAGTVAIHSAQQELLLPVSGQSLDATKPFADEWVIPKPNSAVDFLFVIENSPAMAGREEALRQNFTAMMNELRKLNFDFHVAVTTTDVSATGEQGRFLPLDDSEPRVLTNETPDLESLFARRGQVGSSGASETAGLEAVRKAFDPALLASHNAGFLRDNARLRVIVVSASNDSSPDSLNAYYLGLLLVKGWSRSNEVLFNAVVPSGSWKVDRYALMSERTGGIRTAIESNSWGQDLFSFSPPEWLPRIRFRLSATPADPASIRASIGGVDFPSNTGNFTNWWYEPLSNSTVFNGFSVPEPGVILRIEYPVGCTASE